MATSTLKLIGTTTEMMDAFNNLKSLLVKSFKVSDGVNFGFDIELRHPDDKHVMNKIKTLKTIKGLIKLDDKILI